ncbi:tail protein X [Pseudomonas promysalinigenes]|uniref:Phage tail protein n=2 Tax=Pseudomonas TaxID=286 RepID=A0A0N9MQN1_PSEPU|nr:MULTISPECIES: tail protein X [Pseudomonas]ALG76557.1 phage tail protein [Pseudomonas putida]QXI32771.1 tail protein X [Pseudomonas promysalinigenes]UXH38957.1 tail protein X [Pseudomonas promysalinigenes]
MDKICKTSEGDLLDTLCQHFYGHLDGSVEAVLQANQGLAEQAQPFRSGVMIRLPPLTPAPAKVVQLWD